jgi:hypothetical protein
MASARLQIMVESACNLYISDGSLAGKSDPYVIVEVPGQESMKLQTEAISNELTPVWNFIGEIAGFMYDNVLRFTVLNKDTLPKSDDFLGRAELTAQDFYPNAFHGELTLADSKTQATLWVIVVVTGYDVAAPELVEREDTPMMVPDEFVEGDAILQGVQVNKPGMFTTTTTTTPSMTCSAPVAESAPQVALNVMVTTGIAKSQSMLRQSITYKAPQASVPRQSVATATVLVYPPVTVTAEEFAKINAGILTEPTNREVDFSNTEAVDKTAKIKKKPKRCC